MKTNFFLVLSIFLFLGCKKDLPKPSESTVQLTSRVEYSDKGNALILHSGKFTYQIPKSQLPFKKVMILNASLIGYITELGATSKISGVASPEYIYSNKIHTLINEGKILNIGNEQKYDVEKIIANHPDAVFTNYIESFENTYEVLRKSDIKVIFLDEYLELEPLQKTAYIKVFGKLLGYQNAADSVYSTIKHNYESWKSLASKSTEKPKVLMNEMYGSQWYLPGGKTFAAQYIKDASAQYILSDNQEERSVPLSFEEVLVKSKKAKYWVNAGNHNNKSGLLAVNPNYKLLDVYQNGKIYSMNAREKGKSNDFFESGTVRADLLLRDYTIIFHPELLDGQSLTYMKELP